MRGLQNTGILLTLLLFSGGYAWASASLQDAHYEAISGTQTELTFNFSEHVSEPRVFTVKSPYQIIVDIDNASNTIDKDKLNKILSKGPIKNITVVNSNKKMRLIIQLYNSASFDIKTTEKDLNIKLLSAMTDKPKSLADQSQASVCIKSFDFQRGNHGQAKLIVTLSSPNTNIDVVQQGDKLIAKFMNAKISDKLVRLYSVLDFATVVDSVLVEPKGKDVYFEISPNVPNIDNIAYQLDNTFIIEVNDKSEVKIEGDTGTKVYSGEKLSLNFQDIEVRAVLQVLADFSGFNLVTSDTVAGNITLRLQNVPWDQALDIVLKTKNLDKRQNGNVILVAPTQEIANSEKEQLNNVKDKEDTIALRSELIQISYAVADDMASILKQQSAGGGPSGGVVTTNALLSSRGSVTVDKRTNTLLVQDTPQKISQIRALIQKLDKPVRQVEISTQVVTSQVALTDTLAFKWGGASAVEIGHKSLGIGASNTQARAIANNQSLSGIPSSGGLGSGSLVNPYASSSGSSGGGSSSSSGGSSSSTGTNSNGTNTTTTVGANGVITQTISPSTLTVIEGLFADLTTSTPASVGLAIAKLPGGTLLDLELQALTTLGVTKTLARPKLLTQDQQKATVEQTVQIPYASSTVSSGTVTTGAQFVNTTLALNVTPHITPDNRILMELDVKRDSAGTASGSLPPPVTSNHLSTKVLANNGETIVLGGVMTGSDGNARQKVPFFGDLPFLGKMFRSKSVNKSTSELLIFVTPNIISYEED